MPARTRHARAAATATATATEKPAPTASKSKTKKTKAPTPAPESESESDGEEVEQQEDIQPEGSLQRLEFDETLSWRAGKAIPVADLLQRLETLGLELRRLDQEATDRNSLTKVSHELASGHLLGHRDKGVRAWTACCLVDILRLCAPDAPFTVNRLKDIFTLIVTSIIPALADPSNAYNDQHIYVLSSLADVKSIVLLTDVHAPDTLIVPLFTSCFDIVSGSSKASTGEDLAKNVEYDMTRLLVPIIDEAPSLAPEVVDVIVAQFLRVDPRAQSQSTTSSGKGKKNGAGGTGVVDSKQGTLLLKDYPPAYNMAKAICNACPEKMTSYISQYFNNVILDASKSSNMNGSSKHRRNNLDDSEDEGENIKDLNKAHLLIRELWRACPDVLQNVIPQLEAELSADSISLRLLATQTIGDLAAGIGVAGPPRNPTLDTAAYPPISLAADSQIPTTTNPLLNPISPKPFSQAHSIAFESFFSRRQDKSTSVRAAWATAIGRILLTSAGGTGLSGDEEKDIVNGLMKMLGDADEKVRTAAVEVIGKFGFSDIIKKLGADGGLSEPDSLLSVLAERVKDRKHPVREQAMAILGTMWAVASGEIEMNNDQVVPILKDVPSKIFDAYYTNNLDIQVLLDHVIFEILLPLNYPPIKSKGSKSESRKSKSSRDTQGEEIDADAIRVRRILTLVKGLDERSKKVFFALQGRQLNMRTFLSFYLSACEDYNGGVMDEDEETIKAKLTKVIDNVSKMLPESSRVSADLWKFAKMHDRRSYQLIRFAMAAVSDYRTVTRAIRELSNRISSSTSATTTMLDSLIPLIYRSSSLIFNRSHIPAVMKLSRTDEYGLGNTAHEILRETSSQNPEVLEAHVQEMCKDIEAQAPNSQHSDDTGVEEILKACASFAKKLPAKLPRDRKFIVALTNYAMYSSSPSAAKNAVTIIMATTDKKQMYARDLIKKSVQKCTPGSGHFLTKLATIAQVNLLAPGEADEEGDDIIDIATNKILLKNLDPTPNSGYIWSEEVDEETMAKEWALKILVNRVRSKEISEDDADFQEYAESVYSILNTLIANQGELSKKEDTPPAQKSRLRLLAAKLIVKICASRPICDRLFSPTDFNAVALVVQDQLLEVRSGFIGQLKKRLVQTPHLSARWYTIAFLLAFEPNVNLYESTLTWLRSRSAFFARQSQNGNKGLDKQQHHTTMEALFARLLSLLAHHPDYPPDSTDEATKVDDLVDFTRYILFYLSAVANENNLSLIFHIAQRVKQARDAISDSDSSSTISSRLHTLSDLSQGTIRRFSEFYSHQHKIGGPGGNGVANILQTYPGKMRLPSALFGILQSHNQAQTIAEKNYLPEQVEERLDRVVRIFMKPKVTSHSAAGRKRKAEGTGGRAGRKSGGVYDDDDDEYGAGRGDGGSAKKARKDKKQSSRTVPIRRKKTSLTDAGKSKQRKKRDEDEWGSDNADALSGAARRRSGRGTKKTGVSYAEVDSDQDDKEMEQWGARDEEEENDESEGESESESEASEQKDQSDDDTRQPQKQKQKHSTPDDDEDTQMSDVPSDISSPVAVSTSPIKTRKTRNSPSPVATPKPGRSRQPKSRPKQQEEQKKPVGGGHTRTTRRAAAAAQ